MAISLYVLFLLSITFTLFSFMLERKLINAYCDIVNLGIGFVLSFANTSDKSLTDILIYIFSFLNNLYN